MLRKSHNTSNDAGQTYRRNHSSVPSFKCVAFNDLVSSENYRGQAEGENDAPSQVSQSRRMFREVATADDNHTKRIIND